ncbi:MAG: DNA polymerase III subunit delta [Treponema sp.]|jgi:DNA polymerase-3 subunit delta|nr:DNA polymerase III subunit delta [Treponema sp.]
MTKGRCYLFLGPELGEKQDAVGEIRRSLGGNLEETSFYAGDTAATDMVAALRNGSLFADTRLFSIKNAEALKKKDEVELLAAYMEAPQQNTVLILLSEETKIDKRLETAVSGADKRIFWELFENRKAEWVAGFFRREGYSIGPDAVETVLELVENNTGALRRECSRLVLFLDKKKPVEAADLEKWLSHSREESAFTLFSRIAAGDMPRSIETVHSLLAAGESPQGILPGLVWCYRKLRDYLVLAESGAAHNDFELRKIGLASKKALRDYENAARRFQPAMEAASGALALIAKYDLLTRSLGQAPQNILMDTLVCKLVTGPAQPPPGDTPPSETGGRGA